MLENKHNLTVDTQSKSIGNAFVEVVQNDNVALEVQIYNNNLLVDNTAYTYTLLSVLPSKEKIIRQGSIGPNGYPVFYLGVEEMSETGIVLAMVQVFDELGNRVTSYDFKYRMKEDMSTGGVVPSADNPKFVIITEDSLSQTVQDAQQSKIELDAMKTDTEGVAHLTPNDRLVSDYNKINEKLYRIGITIKNEVLNGDFSDNDDVWISSNSIKTVENGRLKSVNTYSYGSVYQGIKTIIGHKYYFRGDVQGKIGTTYAGDVSNGVYLKKTRETLSKIYTATSYNTKVGIGDASSSDFPTYYLDNVIYINLTLMLGAGNEPTREEMDTLINILGGWFDGEITVTQTQYVTWLLNLVRQNRNTILALGGAIV